MIEELKLYDSLLKKIRLGGEYDGGYVVIEKSIFKSVALFTYGIGNDIRFEQNYVKITGNKAYCFDHTITKDNSKSIIFHKEGLSGFKTNCTNNFLAHYKQTKINGKVYLKIDIEGCEYDFLINTDITKLSELITGLSIEFHDISKNITIFTKCLKSLNKHFYLCHIHGNNFNYLFHHIENDVKYTIPNVMEFTFIPKKLVRKVKLDVKQYPDPKLDSRCYPYKEDYKLSFLEKIPKCQKKIKQCPSDKFMIKINRLKNKFHTIP